MISRIFSLRRIKLLLPQTYTPWFNANHTYGALGISKVGYVLLSTRSSVPDDSLEKRTVVQLREQLKSFGLPISGRKQELIDRLRARPEQATSAPGQNAESTNPTPVASATISSEFKAASPARKSAAKRAQEARDLQAFLNARLRSLYRRCLRSADQCPLQEWVRTLRQYVSMRFRTDAPSESTDKLAVAIANGEAELAQMDLYHKARESRDLERQLAARKPDAGGGGAAAGGAAVGTAGAGN